MISLHFFESIFGKLQQDAVKEDAGHKVVENYLADLGLESWASFRPQYMTGDGNNKDCEEWFFDSKSSHTISEISFTSPAVDLSTL